MKFLTCKAKPLLVAALLVLTTINTMQAAAADPHRRAVAQTINQVINQIEQAVSDDETKEATIQIPQTVAQVCHACSQEEFQLINAAYEEHMGCITALLADPATKETLNIPNREGEIALHLAARSKNHNAHKIMALLLRIDADATLQDMYGYTPLTRAVSEKNERCVKVLLEADNVADFLDLKDVYGRTALDLAATVNLRQLLSEAKDILENRVVEFRPQYTKHLQVEDLFAQLNLDEDYDIEQIEDVPHLFIMLTKKKQLGAIQQLLNRQELKQYLNYTVVQVSLEVAALHGHINIVQALLEHPRSQDLLDKWIINGALSKAAKNHRPIIIDTLLNHSLSKFLLTTKGIEDALLAAIIKNDLIIVRQLFTHPTSKRFIEEDNLIEFAYKAAQNAHHVEIVNFLQKYQQAPAQQKEKCIIS